MATNPFKKLKRLFNGASLERAYRKDVKINNIADKWSSKADDILGTQPKIVMKKHLKLLEKATLKNSATIESYENVTQELRESLSFDPDPNKVNVKARKTIVKMIQENKSLSKREKYEKLKQQYESGVRAKDMLRISSKNDILIHGVAQGLIDIRLTEKYGGMVDSAVRKGYVQDEADFFERTLRKALRLNNHMRGKGREIVRAVNSMSDLNIDEDAMMYKIKMDNKL